MNEHGEYFATDQTAGSRQFPVLLDDKGCPGLAAVCNFPFGMEILEELHRPRRVDFRVADPNGLAYQSHELAEVRLLKPTNAYVVGVIHPPLMSILAAVGFARVVAGMASPSRGGA